MTMVALEMIAPSPARRILLAGAGATLVAAASSAFAKDHRAAVQALAAIEAGIGGRAGVAALNTADGSWLSWRGGERFALCSTFKVALVGAVLTLIDQGKLAGEQRVPFTRADLLSYAPATSARVGEGAISVFDLCAAAVTLSDNTAANLLLGLVGGPAGLTARLRALGDPNTRLDRTEPSLNSNLPGDPRDTTTPIAYARTLRRLLLGDALAPVSRRRLTDWMIACRTGLERLRAGLPPDWTVGDKTGSGERGAINDVAIAWPPGHRARRGPFGDRTDGGESVRLEDGVAAAPPRIQAEGQSEGNLAASHFARAAFTWTGFSWAIQWPHSTVASVRLAHAARMGSARRESMVSQT
jgi:beta-lactamase class A